MSKTLMTPCHFIGRETECAKCEPFGQKKCTHLTFEEFCSDLEVQQLIHGRSLHTYIPVFVQSPEGDFAI